MNASTRDLTPREKLAATVLAARDVGVEIPTAEAMKWRADGPVAAVEESVVGGPNAGRVWAWRMELFEECRRDVEGQIRRFGLPALLEVKPFLAPVLDRLTPST